MRKMKDSGIEWIGDIPEGWEVRRLKYLVFCNRESLPETTDKEKNIEYIDISSVIEGEGIVNSENMSFASAPSRARRIVYENDIIISTVRTYLKAIAYITYRYDKCICSTGFAVLSANNKVCYSKYIYYFISSEYFVSQVTMLSTGISYPAINASQLLEIFCLLPPLPEQQAIASYLDAKCAEIESSMDSARQSIEKLQAYKLSLITEAVTKGLNPDAEMKDSGVPWIGEIPAGWKVIALRYLGACQNGISKAGNFFGYGSPFVSYKDVYQNMALPEKCSSLIDTTPQEQKIYSVQEGDVFFTRTSETIDEIGFSSVCLKTIEHASFAGFLIRFRPIKNKINKSFSKYYFRSEHHRQYFAQMNIVTRASLGQEVLKKLPVLLPPLSEQQAIADYLDTKCAAIDQLIEDKQQLIDKLSEYKKSLIFECVTGKREIDHV